jgi:hypothetical protein
VFIFIWVTLILWYSIEIALVNNTTFNGINVECCYTAPTNVLPANWGPCGSTGLAGSNAINTSQRYKALSAWGLVLIGVTMLTIMVAKKQAHEFKNRGKASKCIIFVLFLEYLAWWCLTIAATAISGDDAAIACWDRDFSVYAGQWNTMRIIMWELWGVMVIFTLALCGVCFKARRKEPLMANQNAAMREPQPQVTVIQTGPAYGQQQQPAYGYGQQQPAYGYGAPQQQQYGY